ncbi:uncharacterized protein [Chelonus insularis]|uniref:uncharacterized protein n=1 Tax=Chelonus insularis TaxID=460826 RepID=UPI00158E0B2B|nr:uncharacterized protein LOC118068930 [Chelonus insularis]XP_034942569.1 uncharacterized protein LOC118068930 [Chelonus insularis]XP_034942570.1 uncharacterized protein LOC118068930 [Chelonus insularis]
MSSAVSSSLTSTVADQITSTLLPTVTKIGTRDDSSSLSFILAFSIVFVLAPVTISGNTMILAAFYRYKRLRTASNCLLASLAVSDFGVGVFIPFGVHLELSGAPESGISSLCILPYCIVITLCSVSVLVTVAIAVDRLTSLAQPLRYKNIITHSSVEKYIAVFWIYAVIVGLTPLIYAKIIGFSQLKSGNCRFGAAVQPPVRVFLVIAVWAPSALVLLGCYIYVYLVARAHARAIYTVELSFRHQTQTLPLPRYGQTLAVTVGAFLILWLPFQTCMLLDIVYGSHILSEWSVVWLGLPILAHSGVNPWIYAFHHGEMRVAAGKIAEDIVTLFGIHPSRYGCSPVGRGGSNLELAEVNKSNEGRRPPIEDCFAAKQQNSFYPRDKRLETTNNDIEISPEANDCEKHFTHCDSAAEIVEEDIHDLAKMLGPEYIIDRCHVIDTNHNVDKIRNLKYLLDPTFNKIRHLRRLNQKSTSCCHGKDHKKYLNQFKFISYQNLKSDINSRRTFRLNALSDPMLNTETPCVESNDLGEGLHKDILHLHQRRDSVLASISDSNIKAINLSNLHNYQVVSECHEYSVQSLDHSKCSHQTRKSDRRTREVNPKRTRNEIAAKWKQASKQLTVTANKLTSFFHPEHHRLSNHHNVKATVESPLRIQVVQKNLDFKHSESIGGFDKSTKLLEPTRFMNTLTVPTIHSEPPSPVDPLPLDALCEEDTLEEPEIRYTQTRRGSSKSPVRHSDPFPYVLLNIEDFDKELNIISSHTPSINPVELTTALKRTSKNSEEIKHSQNLFPDHDTTRFSSRRPSDLRWSESSRSQEVLSNLDQHQKSPSSYSVNNVQTCDSSSDLNDVTYLNSFMCPDALSSSLRESFFDAPSIPDSDTFDETDIKDSPNDLGPNHWMLPTVHSSVSSVNIRSPNYRHVDNENQSKSSESIMFRRRHAILRLQLMGNRGRLCVETSKETIPNDSIKESNNAPLAISTPIEICTPTYEHTPGKIKGAPGIGVRV